MIRNMAACFAVAGAWSACAFGETKPTPQRDTSLRASTVVLPAPPTKNIGEADYFYLHLNLLVPEFGGVYLDSAGILTLALTDTTKLASARQALSGYLGHSVKPWRAVTARYSYSTLAAWRDSIMPSVLSSPGWSGIGIDDRLNVIRIGMVDTAWVSRAIATVAALGIPRNAILVEVQQRSRLL